MTLWITAAALGAVLLAGIAYFAMRRQDAQTEWDRPRHAQPWDRREDEPTGTKMATVPPPSGVPIQGPPSDEIPLAAASGQLWVEDDEPTGPVPKILLSATGGTHAGRLREHNEDAFLVLTEHEVYAVADGMGGYAAGEVASRVAVDTLRAAFETGRFGEVEGGLPRRGAELAAALRLANERVRSIARADSQKRGMGTTVVSTRFSAGKKRVYIAHVGDSRCYRLRDGELAQLTTDHTLGAVGIKGPSAGKLSRAIGVFDHVDVELNIDEPQVGDHYLLCSDGLHKMLAESTIARSIQHAPGLGQAVDALIGAANERGGRDNVTVVLVRVDPPAGGPDESGEHRVIG